MALAKVKTEHSGAKNGGGAWDTRANAKKASNKRRREADKAAAFIREHIKIIVVS